MYRILCSAW